MVIEMSMNIYTSTHEKINKILLVDEEEELVAFSSDEELVIALGSSSGDNFRVYIKGEF